MYTYSLTKLFSEQVFMHSTAHVTGTTGMILFQRQVDAQIKLRRLFSHDSPFL